MLVNSLVLHKNTYKLTFSTEEFIDAKNEKITKTLIKRQEMDNDLILETMA